MITRVLSALVGPQRAPRVRSLLILVSLAISTGLLALVFNPHYPIRDWLFFRYAMALLYTVLFCAAVLCSGNAVVSALSRPGERQDGHITLGFATGVLLFGVCMLLVGYAGGLGSAAFFGVPAALLAFGAPRAYRDLVRLSVRMRGRPWVAPLSAVEALGFAVGAIALAMLYVPILVPENAAYDARWYHLGLAEHYVAEGAIARMPEGPSSAVVPQLASALYTWAFLVPGGELFDRVVLAAHLEYAVFLFTLPGLCALFRYLVPDGRGRLAWLSLFLFPSIFMYDATLTIAADHVAALFAIPTYLCLVRALRDLRPSACALLAIQVAGLLMTKYTAVLAAFFPVLAVLARGAQLTWQRLRGRRAQGGLAGLGAALGTGLLLTAPHWLKNWIWYGDPVFPLLHRYLTLRPWNEDSEFLVAAFQTTASWQAQGTLQQKLAGMVNALYDHSYELYHWVDFHGRYPIFGSLFTFGLVALPWLDRTRRIWGLVIATHAGLALWGLMFRNDRYLQSLLPWMATCVAAIAVLCWRSGWPARAGIGALLALQLVWGLDMPLWPLHRGTHDSGIGAAAAFFARAYGSDRNARTQPFESYASIGRVLPRGARVLLHHDHLRLGIGTMTVTDTPPLQHGINYARLGSPRAVHRRLREFGVTHVVWEPQKVYGDETAAGDLVFHTYVRYLVRPQLRGARMVAEVPRQPPPEHGRTVFYFGCSGLYESGLYELGDLSVSPLSAPNWPKSYPPPRAPLSGDPVAFAAAASYAIVNRDCPDAPVLRGFERIAGNGNVDYLLRAAP